MGRSTFKRDLIISQEAVSSVLTYMIDQGYNVSELEGREEQKKGDIAWKREDGTTNIEVKFDIRAAQTGNLCFEMSNGNNLTGIMSTLADKVYYVVPNGNVKTVYTFDIDKLRSFIGDFDNVKIKNGGDNKKFVLAIAKISDILKAGLPEEVFDIA